MTYAEGIGAAVVTAWCVRECTQRPAFTRLVAGVAGLSNRIWLSGPYGSELYQEQLARCLQPNLQSQF